MFSICPKCEAGKLDTSGTCKRCSYSLRIPCDSCGHPNIPSSKFCGACGYGMTLQIRLRLFIYKKINYIQRFRIKKFAAGLSFGVFLSFFAFGTMGMVTEDYIYPAAEIEESEQVAVPRPNSIFARNLNKELATLMASKDMGQAASVEDFEAILEMLLKHLRPIAERVNRSRFPEDSAKSYSRGLHNFSRFDGLTRGGATMMLFQFLSDFLEFNYRDFKAETFFSDVPRFHFLSVPAAALNKLGLKLAKNNETFGISEPIRIEELFNATQAIIGLAETQAEKASQKAIKKTTRARS